MADDPTVASLRVSAYRIPTDLPESDGTYRWNATDIVIVEIAAGATRDFTMSITLSRGGIA